MSCNDNVAIPSNYVIVLHLCTCIVIGWCQHALSNITSLQVLQIYHRQWWSLYQMPNSITWTKGIVDFHLQICTLSDASVSKGCMSTYDAWTTLTKYCNQCHQFNFLCSIAIVNGPCSVTNTKCKPNTTCHSLLDNLGIWKHNVAITITYLVIFHPKFNQF